MLALAALALNYLHSCEHEFAIDFFIEKAFEFEAGLVRFEINNQNLPNAD